MAANRRRNRVQSLCPVGTEIQSLLLDKDKFSRETAIDWVHDHGYSVRKIDETNNYYRFRQSEPEEFLSGSFRTISLSQFGDIRALIGCPK